MLCVCVVTEAVTISQIQEVVGQSGEDGFLLWFLTFAVDFNKSSAKTHTSSHQEAEDPEKVLKVLM